MGERQGGEWADVVVVLEEGGEVLEGEVVEAEEEVVVEEESATASTFQARQDVLFVSGLLSAPSLALRGCVKGV